MYLIDSGCHIVSTIQFIHSLQKEFLFSIEYRAELLKALPVVLVQCSTNGAGGATLADAH